MGSIVERFKKALPQAAEIMFVHPGSSFIVVGKRKPDDVRQVVLKSIPELEEPTAGE
jgi:hypothetical protein